MATKVASNTFMKQVILNQMKMGEGEGKLSKERSGSIDGGKSSGRKSLDGQDSLSTNNSQEKTSNNTVEEY